MIGLSWSQVGMPGGPSAECATCRRLTPSLATITIGPAVHVAPLCRRCALEIAIDLHRDCAVPGLPADDDEGKRR